ncbi:MAG: urease accessory protein UreD [Rhodoferax sp.]
MSWHAQLQLDYERRDARTIARHLHSGPLRILQSLYPEGDAVCHNVLVHPPGGLVGGDTLDIALRAASGTHGLVTTPGATRFYRSEGPLAVQRTHLTLEGNARVEWLPLETICYSGCHAENHLTVTLDPDAQLMGWDVTALGLPHAGQPFVQGCVQQHLELPGVWLERARVDAQDTLLLNSPAALAGLRCWATLYLVSGRPMDRAAKAVALDTAREVIAGGPLAAHAGATSPNPQTIVVRAMAPQVESVMTLLRQVRLAWRAAVWNMPATTPRIWAM